MVARDRNSASLTVKCHKFLRLVQFVAALCVCIANEKQTERFALQTRQDRTLSYQVVEASDGVGDRCWRESSCCCCCCCKRIVQEFQEYGTQSVRMSRSWDSQPWSWLTVPHDHKRMAQIFVTRLVQRVQSSCEGVTAGIRYGKNAVMVFAHLDHDHDNRWLRTQIAICDDNLQRAQRNSTQKHCGEMWTNLSQYLKANYCEMATHVLQSAVRQLHMKCTEHIGFAQHLAILSSALWSPL